MSDTAYLYPAPYWSLRESGWIKSLLLFFDDVATLLPDYMYGRHVAADPSLAAPLEERGLLHVLEPKNWIDQETTTRLGDIIVDMLTNGSFDDLPETKYFAELSQSRIGYGADVDLATFLVEELQAKGLAKQSEDGVSVPLHPTVRTTILVILGQLSRTIGQHRGMTIHPTTNHGPAVSDLIQTLSMQAMPSKQHVIQLDLEPVAFDLSPIPLSVLRLSDGRVLGLFEGFDCRLRLMVPGCRTVVDASSGFAAPPLRSGPSGDPSPSIRRRAAMAVSRAFGHVPIARHNVAMTSGGGCYPLPLPCLSRGWGR